MNSKSVAAAICLGLVTVTAGCGSSNEGYVDFEKTAPATPEQKSGPTESDGQVSEPSGTGELPSDVSSARATVEPDPAGLNHTVSSTQSTTSKPVGQPEPDSGLGTKPASATESDAAAVKPSETEASGSSAAADAAKVSTSDPSTDTSTQAATPQIVSPQSGLIGPADNPQIENAASSEPRKIELLIPEKVFRRERGSDAVRVSYDDLDLLKILNMEPVPANAADYFPEWLTALDGKSIRIRGFMYPTFEATGLTAFTLARDNGICCFVRQPKIYDIISVQLASGVTTDYIEGRPFDVEGILHIEPFADENDLSRLYRIDEARVLR